jgi:hypothetical protein
MIVYSVHGWRHFLVCNTHIAFRLLRRGKKHESMHFLVILSLKTLWAGVKHWRTALHRFYVYRKHITYPRSRNLKVIKKFTNIFFFNFHLYFRRHLHSRRFGALKSDSTHHLFRNACTKSGSLRFSQFSGCWLILSVYILTSFDFPVVRLFGVR